MRRVHPGSMSTNLLVMEPRRQDMIECKGLSDASPGLLFLAEALN